MPKTKTNIGESPEITGKPSTSRITLESQTIGQIEGCSDKELSQMPVEQVRECIKFLRDQVTELQQSMHMAAKDCAMLRVQSRAQTDIIDAALEGGKSYRIVAQNVDRTPIAIARFTIKREIVSGDTVVVRLNPENASQKELNLLMEVVQKRKGQWLPEAKRVMVAPPGVEFFVLETGQRMGEAVRKFTKDAQE